MLTVIDKGKFTGVQYNEIKQRYIDHHHSLGHDLIWLDRVLILDEEGLPTETPTKAELQNIVSIEPESEIELLTKRIEMLELELGAK